MKVTITPRRGLSGDVTAPPSKAHTHRALFAGLLSHGITEIENPLLCDDTETTATAISALGASLERRTNVWTIRSNGHPTTVKKEIHCGESGVTLRFTIPIASLTGEEIMFTGSEGLIRRPIEPLAEAMDQLGVKVASSKRGIRVAGGPPLGGRIQIRGDVSSQFVSGLLLAAPMMREGLRLEMTSPLESRGYVRLTMEVMKHHGIQVKSNDEMSLFEIEPKQVYAPATDRVPGDFSSASFVMSAAAITNSKLLIRGLLQENSEPDSVVVSILSKMGIATQFVPEGLFVEGGRLNGIIINIRDCPDLGPILAVLGCYADGETRITGAGRLRYKESDRLNAVASELRVLGGEIEEINDSLLVHGPRSLQGGNVHSHGDHRVAMALSAAALRAKGQVVIEGAECVSKSYPTFFNDLRLLGVEVFGR
ncbi:MAG: 3-phosphoshikimate 1-carboxyvinyltransferase [Candidatus Bathyarchaeia archaeon]